MRKFVKFIYSVIKGAIDDHIWEYSAQAAFFMTISFVPLIMLLISMIGYLPFTQEELLGQVLGVFPQSARGFVSSFINEVYLKGDIAVISVSAITTLWAASMGVYGVTKGINRVYTTSETRNFIVVRIMSMIHTLIVLVLFVLCLITYVFGNTITEALSKSIPQFFGTAIIIMSMRTIAGVTVLGVIFLVMFMVIPNRKLHLLAQVPGAIISAIGWIGFSSVFSYYYENMASYSYVYGSLSVLIFFMLWLFFCIYILLIGAEINKYIEEKMNK